MNQRLTCQLVLLFLMTAAMAQTKTSYVDPFIGTDGMGHTFPGACVPFGGVRVLTQDNCGYAVYDSAELVHLEQNLYRPAPAVFDAPTGDLTLCAAPGIRE